MVIKRLVFFLFLFFCTTIQAGVIVVNGLTHTYTVEEGTILQGVITIQNTAEEPQDVKLFLSDYSYQADGRVFYGDSNDNPRSNANWVFLSTTFVSLKGKEKTDILYEIKVPEKGSLSPGAYWSVVMVEPVEHITPTDDKSNLHITSLVRYAIQIITQVKPEKASSLLKFENVELNDAKETNQQVLQVDLANRGTLYHKVTVKVKLYGQDDGHSYGEFSSDLLSLLPSTSKRFQIVLDNIVAGNYSAIVTAETDNDQAFGLQLDLELQDE